MRNNRQEILDWIQDIEDNVERDYCMCGDHVDHSPWTHGHSPVSQYVYYMSCAEDELRNYDSTDRSRNTTTDHSNVFPTT